MQYKIEREFIFDIHDIMEPLQAQRLLVGTADELGLVSDHVQDLFWLPRKSSNDGILTIESMKYNHYAEPAFRWQRSETKRLRLTTEGWWDFDDISCKGKVLPITKDNLTPERVQELKEKLQKDYKLNLKNMIYPEIKWADEKAKAAKWALENLNSQFTKVVPEDSPVKGIIRGPATTGSKFLAPMSQDTLPVIRGTSPLKNLCKFLKLRKTEYFIAIGI
ncbi:Uncharacterised protein [Legionella busanensis]|uniref:Uncharacterized protein n=1 Tax=Legionella busanensis TaxID=190655 RepID=A0A378K9J1_9GAMM|nr:hypothetical protein [Legionella busanensis]STX81376.1 Uncharacterised protein [Legionella busanensis]